MVSMYARYSAVKHDATGADTESLWKVGAKANFGMVGFGLDYGQTNDRTGSTIVTGMGLTGDADAKVNLQGWGLNLQAANDSSLLKVNVNTKVAGFGLSANYNILKNDAVANSDAKEYYAQVSQKIGKNLSYYVRLGQTDRDSRTDKGTRGRVHVQYSF
jgi:predicted porin